MSQKAPRARTSPSVTIYDASSVIHTRTDHESEYDALPPPPSYPDWERWLCVISARLEEELTDDISGRHLRCQCSAERVRRAAMQAVRQSSTGWHTDVCYLSFWELVLAVRYRTEERLLKHGLLIVE